MDLITQGLLGASVACAIGSAQKIGRRAILIAFIAGMLPDADMLCTFCIDSPLSIELYHRGLTHSLFFAPLLAPILGGLSWWLLSKNSPARHRDWMQMYFWVVLTHPLLDLFTSYGTQLFAPFLDHRFSLSAIPIIDPVYSVPLLIGMICGFASPYMARSINASLLFLTTCYLFFGLQLHDEAMAYAHTYCANENLVCRRIHVSPLIPTLFSQRFCIETDTDYRVAEGSLWNKTQTHWHIEPKTIHHSEQFYENPNVKIYQWYADFTTVPIQKKGKNCLVDARYGSVLYPELVFGYSGACFDGHSVYKFHQRRLGFKEIFDALHTLVTRTFSNLTH